uniref:Uncharacterized protein n=1 Tax=Cannabis sativa TaxID=3483 RepID=A0A803QZ15_CANSA
MFDGDAPLKESFPNLAVISQAQNVYIKDMMAREGRESSLVTSWNFKFRRCSLEGEMPSMLAMSQMLEYFLLIDAVQDSKVWRPESNGVFFCESAFSFLSLIIIRVEVGWAKVLWKSCALSKVKSLVHGESLRVVKTERPRQIAAEKTFPSVIPMLLCLL